MSEGDAPQGGGSPQRRRILMVDDQALVRVTVAKLLRRHHDVLEAAGGAEAIARLEGGERFDAILCDLRMPDVDGAAVFAAVRARWPGMARRVALLTGEPESATTAALEAAGAVILLKPCGARELLAVVERLTGDPGVKRAPRRS